LLDGLSGSVIRYNVPIFKTGQLSPGSHTLEVGYQSSPTTAPLTLGHYLVQNAPSSGSGPSTSTPLSTPSRTPPSTTKKSNIGGIIGGIVRGLGIITLALFLFFFLRRRRNRKEMDAIPVTQPYTQPFSQIPASKNSGTSPLPSFSPVRRPSQYHVTRKLRAETNPDCSATHRSPDHPSTTWQPSAPIRIISSGGPSSKVVLHEDSGIRMIDNERVVDIPPLYTPG